MSDQLTDFERMRVQCVLLNQALCEMIHASNLAHEIPEARRQAIYTLAKETMPFESDESNNRVSTRAAPIAGLRATDHTHLLKALREMINAAEGKGQEISEKKGAEIHALANADSSIASMLANDEESTDEKLVTHFMQTFGMREIEAREHLKQRQYLLRFMPGK